MSAEEQKMTETIYPQWKDLLWPGDCGRMRYQPGAYLAVGAEYLNHAACRLGELETFIDDDPYEEDEVSTRDVSLLYPCEWFRVVATASIPFGDLVLQLHPFHAYGGRTTPYRVGIPVSVHRVLCDIITKRMSHDSRQRGGEEIGHCKWYPKDHVYDEHVWIFAETDERDFKAVVCVDGKCKEVNVSDLLKQVGKNLKCDALTTLKVERGPSTNGYWTLRMTLLDLLITDTTSVASRPVADDELVGRTKYSSPEVVSAFAKLQAGTDGGAGHEN